MDDITYALVKFQHPWDSQSAFHGIRFSWDSHGVTMKAGWQGVLYQATCLLCGVLVWVPQPLSVALMELLHYWAIKTFTAITT